MSPLPEDIARIEAGLFWLGMQPCWRADYACPGTQLGANLLPRPVVFPLVIVASVRISPQATERTPLCPACYARWILTMPPGTCVRCGCDEDHACPGGCSWITPQLCSQCATPWEGE